MNELSSALPDCQIRQYSQGSGLDSLAPPATAKHPRSAASGRAGVAIQTSNGISSETVTKDYLS